MRAIVKGPEPASLTEHRCNEHADYENYADKDTLRRHLVAEQRGICCYCMARIGATATSMKIEHWRCQERHPDAQLDYRNLLGACLGGQGQPAARQHCDTRKGNDEISWNPASPGSAVADLTRYDGDGLVRSDNESWDRELNEVLNLNAPFLRNNRKATLEAFKSGLVKRGHLARETLERMLRKWNGEEDANFLDPFCQVIVYWLRKRIARE